MEYITEVKKNDVLCGRGSGPVSNNGTLFISFHVHNIIYDYDIVRTV